MFYNDSIFLIFRIKLFLHKMVSRISAISQKQASGNFQLFSTNINSPQLQQKLYLEILLQLIELSSHIKQQFYLPKLKPIMIKISIFILAIVFSLTDAKDIPFDLILSLSVIPTSHYQCVRQQWSDVIMWLPFSEKGMAEVSKQSYYNARNAGLRIQAATSPCRSLSVQSQVQEIIKVVGQVDRLWIYPVAITSEACKWQYTGEENCQFIYQFVAAIKNAGYQIGLAGLSVWWQAIFGFRNACAQLSDQLFAWVPSDKQQDGQPNFDSYIPIGGWQHPDMKWYKNNNICGRSYNMIYYK